MHCAKVQNFFPSHISKDEDGRKSTRDSRDPREKILDMELEALSKTDSQEKCKNLETQLKYQFLQLKSEYKCCYSYPFENLLVETEEKGELEAGRARLDKLQAKSSSVYLCLTWEDPILAAFYLIEQADASAFDEPIFKVAANIT